MFYIRTCFWKHLLAKPNFYDGEIYVLYLSLYITVNFHCLKRSNFFGQANILQLIYCFTFANYVNKTIIVNTLNA